MRIYLGIPFYGGAGAEFVSALLKTRIVLDRLGCEVEVDMHNGCSVLPRARNEIVQRFLESGFEKLLFIDSDMSWSPVDAVKLIRQDVDVCGINYRKKTEDIDWNAIPTGHVDGGLVEVSGAGTGFLAISRACLLTMQERYPETRYTEGGKDYHALFDFLLYEGRYWGEDYTFCRRWREIGGKVWIMPGAEIKHIGTKAYVGKYEVTDAS